MDQKYLISINNICVKQISEVELLVKLMASSDIPNNTGLFGALDEWKSVSNYSGRLDSQD